MWVLLLSWEMEIVLSQLSGARYLRLATPPVSVPGGVDLAHQKVHIWGWSML